MGKEEIDLSKFIKKPTKITFPNGSYILIKEESPAKQVDFDREKKK